MNTGFLPNPFDPRDAWEDEIAGGENVSHETIPPSFLPDKLSFEPQGAWPFCVAFSGSKLLETLIRRTTGETPEFSQMHLFFRSGGTRKGSWFRAVLEVMRQHGCIDYGRMPMPEALYDLTGFEIYQGKARDIPFDPATKSAGYVRIDPSPDAVRKAIVKYGAVQVGVAASGVYWKDRTQRPTGAVTDHAAVLDGYAGDGAFRKLDSLRPSSDYDGYHFLSPDYAFDTVYALTALPDDWKERRDAARTAPPGNADRYGKPRDYEAELKFAAQMLAEFQRFKNQSVLEAAGRFWELYIRAGVYGGYNLSYRKWGTWQPGDLINDCYHWRRTGKHIFDFDLPRDQQGF
ncbi:MAG: hypothetical protein Q8Q08_12875 [Candidatus Omnitrophota bacterium]|nr:hypothetical protein [Candidatus Omnitrophota bacterium]